MYKCIVHMHPRRGQAIFLSSFRDLIGVCVFHVGMCNVDKSLCAVVCMALTVHEHRGLHTRSLCAVSSCLTSKVSGLLVGQKLRGTWPDGSEESSVHVRKSCVSANTEEMSTVQRLASSLTPSLSP